MECRRASLIALLTILTPMALLLPSMACAGAANVSVYGVHMDPSGQDAKDFSRSSYGGGLHASFPVPRLANLLAGSLGIEIVNMLSETHQLQDPKTGLRVEQQTNQNFFRLYLGPVIGPQGNGFFRPHLGAHIALINYDISTDVVVPDDANRQNEIRQNLSSQSRTVFGYSFSADTDLNFGGWFLTGGARFAKSFNVPQQLGAGAVSIHPGYVQIYAGVGANFRY